MEWVILICVGIWSIVFLVQIERAVTSIQEIAKSLEILAKKEKED